MKLLNILAISAVVGGASFTVQAAKVLVVLSDASELELKKWPFNTHRVLLQ